MTLKNIELTEEQQRELKDKLDAWKLNEKKRVETELTEKYEQMEAELKEEYEDTVEEIKENMKKVYTKRFMNALKEMYEEVKAQVVVESLESPEAKALEEVKATVFPLINESTAKRYRDEFAKLAEMYESNLDELSLLKGRVKKAQLMESLSPDVRKVVDKLLGEGTEEEVVEKFSTIKSALKEESAAAAESSLEESTSKKTLRENYDVEEEYDDEEDEDVYIDSEVDEDDEDVDLQYEDVNEPEFEKFLNEQLTLAGLRKAR